MPSQASRNATLKVSPNLTVTLLAANLRDFLRGTDQGWLYLEVGLFALLHRLSSSEVRLLRRSIERNEDSPKDAHQRQLSDGHFLFESHHDVGALDENSRLLPCSSRCSVPVLLGPGSADVVSSVWRERSRRAPAIRHFWAPTDSAAEIPSRG